MNICSLSALLLLSLFCVGHAQTSTFPVLTRQVFIQSPTPTSDKYMITANNIDLPNDISSHLSDIRDARKPVHIFAVHLNISDSINLVGVPNLSIHVHSINFKTAALVIDISAPPQDGVPGFPVSPSGQSAGDIVIFAASVTEKTPGSSSSQSTFILKGAPGVAGKNGKAGEKGADGTRGTSGSCRTIRGFCVLDRGSKGNFPERGGPGEDGGDGGNGGHGGSFSVLTSSSSSVSFSVLNNGGAKGAPGIGGPGGPSGKRETFNFINSCPKRSIKKCTNVPRPHCNTVKKCEAVRLQGTQPSGGNGPDGLLGDPGQEGRKGLVSELVPNSQQSGFHDPNGLIPRTDVARIAFVLHRYYIDLVLSRSSRLEAIGIMNSLISLGTVASGDAFVTNLATQAKIMRQRTLLNDDVFTRGRLSREVPSNMQTRLEAALDLADNVKQHIVQIEATNDVTDAVLGAAAVSIPATNIGALQDKLRSRRNTLKEAVLKLDNEIGPVMVQVNENLRRLQRESEQADRQNFVSAIFGVIGSAFGFDFGNSGDGGNGLDFLSDPFALLDAAFTAGEEFLSAENGGCDLDELKEFLEPAQERRTKFPNTVDLDSDFSEISDVGSVATLTKALISGRSINAVAQLECLFSVNLNSFGRTKALMENLFNLMGSRVDVLNEMMSIDLELNELRVIAEGIEKQKESLLQLASSVPSKERALLEVSVTFEQTRVHILRLLQQQADGFGFLALRKLDEEVRGMLLARLHNNGMFGFDDITRQMTSLQSLRFAVLRRYDAVRACFRSNQAHEHYFWDISRDTHPLLFQNGGLTTGRKNRSLFELNLHRDCASSRSSLPHPLGLPLSGNATSAFCSPNNDRYYSRVSGFAVEFIEADSSLVPPGINTLTVSLLQIGGQMFRRTPSKIVSFDVEPMTIVVPLVSTGNVQGAVQYRSPCGVDQLSLTEGVLGSSRICPSAFTAYELQVEDSERPQVHAYLNSAKAVRVHARIASFATGGVVEECEPPVIVSPIRKGKGNQAKEA